MSRRFVLALNDFNAGTERAKRAYDLDPFALTNLLDTPCASCRWNVHRNCTGRVHIPGERNRSIECGCELLNHPRQRRRTA